MTIRDDIADVLSTVSGVTGHRTRPNAPGAGDAWPQWAGSERPSPGLPFVDSWHVFVILGGDGQTAADRVDELRPLVAEALEPVLYVEDAEPTELAIANSSQGIPALQLNATVEMI